MSGDFLLELSKNPQARQLIKSLGLPIPMPQDLRRARGPRTDRPLADRAIAVAAGPLAPILAHTLCEAGADSFVLGGPTEAFAEPGEAWGRPARDLDLMDDRRFAGLVLDATGVDSAAGLRALHDFFHPLIGRLARCGRVVVLGRTPESRQTTEAAAAQAALQGFVRSVAREVGKAGSTAQLVTVEEGADERLAGPLRFLLSTRSAYVTGQALHVSGGANTPASAQWVCPLEHKVALVTGAARGIGAATARILAEEGATVVCLDRPADDGPTSRIARELDGDVLLCDVTDPDAPRRISAELLDKHGGVDVVVHNAGITRDKTLKRMSPELWDLTLDVNLGAVARITHALVESGALRDDARVVCLSSIAGISGNLGQTNYAASKAGILGLVSHLAPRLGERGITVNAIAPGFIETRLTDAIPFAIREVARRMNSLGQGGRPADVGQAIAFLSTPQSVGITGQYLRVCGGSLVGR